LWVSVLTARTMITSQLLLVDEVLRAASKKEVDNAHDDQ
jgi:hypothetical protein